MIDLLCQLFYSTLVFFFFNNEILILLIELLTILFGMNSNNPAYLEENRTTRDVLFIDASNEFIKGKNQNKLSEENIIKSTLIGHLYQT
jgi:type I restriction-modification system DNA methylase subunit